MENHCAQAADDARDAMRCEMEHLKRMLAAAPGGCAVLRADACFTMLQMNEGYYGLMGYTPREHYEAFQNIWPATLEESSRETSLQTVKEQISSRGSFQIKARMRHKTRGPVWGKFQGKLYQESGREPSVYVSIEDVDEQFRLTEKLESLQAFNTLLSTLSNDAFFDFDVASRTMKYSENFANRLGISEEITNYPTTLLNKGIIAEDSLPLYKNRFQNTTKEIVREKLHFILPNGQNLWYSCHYITLLDHDGKPMRVVGKLGDITRHVEQVNHLSHKAERDQLTGLYNKATTEYLIREALKMRRYKDDHCALLIIDVDGFKGVNDHLGHLYGDLVLTELADELKGCFRSDDILGRIGGDEFFVFIKNYRSIDVLEQKAQTIGTLFQKTYSNRGFQVDISASIGIVLSPQHGIDFEELYQRADLALYSAKAQGKNRFLLYNGEDATQYQTLRTEIDRIHPGIQPLPLPLPLPEL